jgi:hypothetical protein
MFVTRKQPVSLGRTQKLEPVGIFSKNGWLQKKEGRKDELRINSNIRASKKAGTEALRYP